MDSDALDTGVALPLAVNAHPTPLVGPGILQLSPIPGNIYESNCFFYNHTADISRGDFVGSHYSQEGQYQQIGC
jgi:hypothetical protein